MPTTFKNTGHSKDAPTIYSKKVHAFLGLVGYYRKFIKNFAKIPKPLTLLTRQQVKFEGIPEHQEAFMKLKESIIQIPILRYPNPSKRYIVYTDASDDACGTQLTQQHDGTEFPIPFLSHTFWRPKESGVQLNKRPVEFIMLSPNGITISKVQTLQSVKITSHLQNFRMEKMPCTRSFHTTTKYHT